MRSHILPTLACLLLFTVTTFAGSPTGKPSPGKFRPIPNFGVQQYAPKTPKNSRYFPDRIIVKLKPGSVALGKQTFGVTSLDMFAQQYGARAIEQTFPNHSAPDKPGLVDLTRFYTFKYNRPIDAFKVAHEFARRPEVEYAEPWFIYEVQGTAGFTPSDTSFAKQWALKKILADTAWTVSKGDTTVVLAIDDTGVEWDHPDLIGNIWYNPGEMGQDSHGNDKRTNGIDDDGDGKIDDWHGWDFAGADVNNPSEDNDPRPTGDNTAHGTHVTGIADAATDNTTGIAGVGFHVKFLPLKASADNDFGGTTGAASIIAGFPAMIYAADMGATAVNCSWGGAGYSQYEQDVVNYVTGQGTLVIAASGNGNTSDPSFPASYANVISVASTNIIDAKSGYSNYGVAIDVCAPGGDALTTNRGILSTYFPNTYAIEIGTSQATPHVTGLAGLVKSVFPAFTAQQIGEQIRVTCDDISAINGSFPQLLGKGRINALRALTTTPPSLRVTALYLNDSTAGNNNGLPDPGETIQLPTVVTNFLQPSSASAAVTLTSTDPYVQVVNGAANLGTINTLQDDSLAGSNFQVLIKNTMPADHIAYFTYNFTDGGYTDFQWIGILCNPSYRTQSLNNIAVTFTNNGNVGFHDFPNNIEGIGFVYNGGNQLFEGGLLVGNSTKVVDVVRNDLGTQDADFVSNGIFTIHTPGLLADQEGTTSFSDSGAVVSDRLGIHVDMTTYMFSTPADRDYVILRFDLTNTTGSLFSNLYAGMFTDWDMLPAGTDLVNAPVNYYLDNRTGFDSGRGMGYAWYDTTIATTYAGVRGFGTGIQYFGMSSDSSSADKVQKWRWISGPNHYLAGVNDVCFTVSSGPYTIPPGVSQPVGFAMVGGVGLANLTAHADAALAKWNTILATILGKPLIDISIHQNPAFTKFADLYVSSDSALVFAPIMTVDNGASGKDTLAMTRLADTVNVYKASYQFSSAGSKTIAAHAVTVGGLDTTVQKSFQAAVAQPTTAASISTPADEITLRVPAGSVSEETWLLAYSSGPPDPSLKGTTFTLSPAVDFRSPVTLEIHPGALDAFRGKERFVHLYRRDRTGWTRLDGLYEPSTGIVRTTVSSLGDFRIAIDEQAPLKLMPDEFALSQNYPNPFNPTTRIGISLPNDARVRIRIFNLLGQQVRLLTDAQRVAGYGEVVWDGKDDLGTAVATGVYLCKAEFYDGGMLKSTATRKMVMMK